MWLVGGKWNVAKDERISNANPLQLIIAYKVLTYEGIQYLSRSSFAIFVTLKSTGAVTFGCSDVLNVRLSHKADDEARDSTRLGILFAMFGLGCLIGPLISDRFVSMKRPRSIHGACVIAFAVLSMGFAGMGLSRSFHSVCISTVIRGCGSSVLWINSTLLLQKYSQEDMLGRVMSVDLALCTLITSISAFVAGSLEDKTSLGPQDVCIIMALVGFFIFIAWSIYFCCGNVFSNAAHAESCNGVENSYT